MHVNTKKLLLSLITLNSSNQIGNNLYDLCARSIHVFTSSSSATSSTHGTGTFFCLSSGLYNLLLKLPSMYYSNAVYS